MTSSTCRRVVAFAATMVLIAVPGACSSSDTSSDSGVASTTTATAAPTTSLPATSTTPATTSSASEPAYAAGLRATLASIVDAEKVPSAVVVVRSSTSGDATFTFGSLILGESTPPSVVDHYRIGSETKPMTATIVLQLVQEGQLALDDPISKYRSDVPNGENITIAQLLDMRSGLPSYTEDPAFLRTIDEDRERVWRPEDLVAMAFTQAPLFPPGTSWHYSNTNYILLGLVIEQITGQSLHDLFQQRLFDPLGMKSSVLPEAADASMPEPYAHGYHFGTAEETGGENAALPPAEQQAAAAGTLRPHDWSLNNPSWGWAAGSVISTADDLTVFVEALVDGGLLDPTTQQQRLAAVQPTSPDGSGIGYGMGLMKFDSYYGHNGQIPGYNAFMVRDPDTRTSIVILTSLTSSPDGQAPANDLATATITALAEADTAAPSASTPATAPPSS